MDSPNNKSRMTPQEIVKADTKNHGGSFEQAYTELSQLVESGQVRILRHENNLYIFRPDGDKSVDGYLMSGDGKNIAQSANDFALSLQKAGITNATITVSSKEEAAELNNAGYYFTSQDAKGQSKFSLMGGDQYGMV